MTTFMKNTMRKMQEAQKKAYVVVMNQRGESTSTGNIMWTVVAVAIVVLAWGFWNGWLPEIFNSIKSKAQTILK
ncbi:hypothetical protein J6TS7_20820 [Paenibacillus dendritiformis]|uniref:hypothetical protein n=1 Tax=Paenibacillus TaxID=44249 RepID=UPI001B01EB59|nr:hypothetical protein [Paenibacillus dendritiformis]GIO78472.1 hypothetical protein J6TS7_20820 [Paenibacillus dendritiformis]